MADGEITWGGLVLGGDTDYAISEISGWEDLADVTDLSVARVRGHGDHVGDIYARGRVVTVMGQIADSVDRDALAQALRAATPVSSEVTDLSVDLLGQALTAGARLVRRTVTIARTYDVGEIPFALQWRCPDPLRYGQSQPPVSTGLPTSSGGLSYPLAYPLDYGTAGTPGQVTLTNEGTAPAPFVFEVFGGSTTGLPGGFELSAGTQRLVYPTAVSPGETLTGDTAAGTLVAEGTADRRGFLTVADWMQVPAGGSLTIQFTSLGGFDAAASFTVPSFRSAFW